MESKLHIMPFLWMHEHAQLHDQNELFTAFFVLPDACNAFFVLIFDADSGTYNFYQNQVARD